MSGSILPARSSAPSDIALIEAPTSLGLRPLTPGHEPGCWRAPAALMRAGLGKELQPQRHVALPHPTYRFDRDPGSTIRNGTSLRAYCGEISGTVAAALSDGLFPLVIGGDCSILLGCLAGAKRSGPCALIHVDGHADFYHPGNYDVARPGSAAGMDLALATGRGEALLSRWGEPAMPLVDDLQVVQIGERESEVADYSFPDFRTSSIHKMTIESFLRDGPARAGAQALARSTGRVWLHVDVDVLDQSIMPAVDSPGTPGMTFDQLSGLIRTLLVSGRLAGANIAIFDPELDPTGAIAGRLAHCIAAGFHALRTARISG
ncbi:arginase family protein [Sphingomonas alpina]|uniref:arginase family protein n=1 Tax=Sphingomonas alpina TaxID=653931 RepID=UPI0021BB9D84|nr:arginase family protein [Sphingomonas alpina]